MYTNRIHDFVVNLHVMYTYLCHIMQVKEHFENSGYTAHGEPVDVLVTSDEEIVTVTVQSVTTGWNVQVRDLFNAHVIAVYSCVI